MEMWLVYKLQVYSGYYTVDLFYHVSVFFAVLIIDKNDHTVKFYFTSGKINNISPSTLK